jgi:hypothetical protein
MCAGIRCEYCIVDVVYVINALSVQMYEQGDCFSSH